MLDNEVKVATCKVACGYEIGSGTLITSRIVLTAGHCLDGVSEVNVTFDVNAKPSVYKACVLTHDEDLDIALLELEAECEITPLNLCEILPLGGSRFYSYGWPVSKLTLGHRIEGSIVQIFDNLKVGSDIEISIDEPLSLNDYDGFSGSAIVCNGACVGVIRVSVEKTIGVVSISRLRNFLNSFGIEIETNEKSQKSKGLASRNEFVEQFDEFVFSKNSSYLFISGSHGIGKSTFCEAYKPKNSSLEHFGTYSFTPKESSKNAVQLAQPQEFFNWLNMQVSMLITGTPGRKETTDYHGLINKAEQLFLQLSQKYSSMNKKGVLFIDGLDEVERQNTDALNEFLGILPQKLASGLVIVFSAPNYEQFATRLGNRLSNGFCISMPYLSDTSVQNFCYEALISDHVSYKTVSIICERAQGHALYLRYLIDLANSGTSNDELEKLPLIEGSIRKYYDSLWLKLKEDNDAVNLLAIAVRLRWGISISHFTEILTPNEQAILISTLGRIQHLLLEPSYTTIYHSSFSEFLLEKTILREEDIQLRLVEYCEKQQHRKYSLLNLVYHGIKAKSIDKAHVVELCTQNWVDNCVYQGVDPDTLLEDLKGVLKVSTELGSLVQTVRILLLNQRIQFRYNTLFAQSADLTASALISIGKEQEVLQHLSRYGQLIIPLEQALNIAFKLIQSSNYEKALELLNIVENYLTEALEQVSEGSGLSYSDFLDIYDLQVQQYLLKLRAGDEKAQNILANFQFYWMKVIDKTATSQEVNNYLRAQMMAYTQAASMCLIYKYMSISQLREFYSGPLYDLVEPIVLLAPLYQTLCDKYDVQYDNALLGQVFSDIQTLISKGWNEEVKVHPSMLDCYISLGAPKNIISKLDEDVCDLSSPISFIANDNVSIDYSELENGLAKWRLVAFTDPEFAAPNLTPLTSNTWLDGIDSICKAVTWCDGAARRLKEDGDVIGQEAVWKTLSQDILNQLSFSLEERVQWEDAYGLPESIIPYIYQLITKLVTEVYPTKISDLLSFIEEQFDSQCGIYSEGFRSLLSRVLTKVVSNPLEVEQEDQAFLLLDRWKSFVASNLENRYELVPELLGIIPLYAKLDAIDEANKTYQLVLSFSMGPSWYKEDQLGLSITALESVAQENIVESEVLSKIAELLDAADGEMTFQRFVRYAKRDFIGALCKRGSFKSAIIYFIRQTYGTLEQMYQEITLGEIDRVSVLRGTRFPGTALDEQDSILSLITPLISRTNWQLSWALLECFQFGDSRYEDRFARAYGLLIDKIAVDRTSLDLALDRIEVICESEFNNLEERSDFVSSVASYINDHLKETFEARFPDYIMKSDVESSTTSLSKDANYDSRARRKDYGNIPLPGTFGSNSSIDEANVALSNASRYLNRKNNSAAKREVISALNAIQNGGWPLWNDSSPCIKQAKSLLLETDSTTSDLVKLFSPFIVDRRYVENWKVAESLITWLASNCPHDEQIQLLKLSNEHTNLLVGNLYEKTDSHLFKDNDDDLSDSLTKLMLHVINHPTWGRRLKASEMLIWLSKNYSDFTRLFGAKAFSMDSGIHPDLICGALEQTSTTQQAWETLAQELDFNLIQQDCKHVGRYTTLVRIAEQAAERGSESAEDALGILKARSKNIEEISTHNYVDLPIWAECISTHWSKLEKLGLANSRVLSRAKSILQKECSPLSIEDSLELEQLLAEGYCGNVKSPHRWFDKVCYAFQVALAGVTNESEHRKIETIFRKYNPANLDNLRIINFKSLAINWINSPSPNPLHGNSIYLDYCERVWLKDKLRLVRMTAYITDNPNSLSVPSGRFSSTEKPSQDKSSLIDTCANVNALPAYFGSFTPAIPTSHFMAMTEAKSSDFKRGWWMSGRLKEKYEGAPTHEGCFLSIESNALRLPYGFSLIWVLELDLKPVKLISFG